MLKQVLDIYELLDDARVTGGAVEDFLRSRGLRHIRVERIKGEKGSTDFIQVVIPGVSGKKGGGRAPTLGIIGRLGGIGARPARIRSGGRS